MRMHWLAKLGAVAVALSPVAARAAMVAPHDATFTDGNCVNCHNLYDATSVGGLDFSGGCNACHATRLTSTLSFPTADTEAKPGVRGTHHSFSGYADNPAYGAAKPVNPLLVNRLVDGQRMQCAVCHDLHNDASSNAPYALHTVPVVGAATLPNLNATATPGTERLTITTPGTISRGYRVKLVSATSYIVSTVFGVNPVRWLNWSGTAWVAGVENPAPAAARTFTPGVAALINPAEATGMSISISAAGVPGDQWDLLVAYPGLRSTMAGDNLCLNCHGGMAMGFKRVAGNDSAYPVNGTRMFSHPVGEALGANGLASDRTEILDATGATQAVGDGNTTNDLVLKDGVVRCTTCHAIHGADSNSMTTDVR